MESGWWGPGLGFRVDVARRFIGAPVFLGGFRVYVYGPRVWVLRARGFEVLGVGFEVWVVGFGVKHLILVSRVGCSGFISRGGTCAGPGGAAPPLI